MSAEPMWRRGLLADTAKRLEETNRGIASRLALVRILAKTGHFVSLITVHQWTRQQQGQAYLWARAFLLGREDVPAPEWVTRASR
jgi:hypothetical protein